MKSGADHLQENSRGNYSETSTGSSLLSRDMATGKVKFFNTKNKFGFIIEHGSGKEYYVHIKDTLSELKEGDEVEFETADSKRGKTAILVRKKT